MFTNLIDKLVRGEKHLAIRLRLVDDGALVECGERRLDLGEAVVDLLRNTSRSEA